MHPAEPSAAPRPHVSSAGADSGSESPTLFSLLYMLGSERFTTSEQRQQIRGVISDFLANEIPHSKVYLHLGQIVGHNVLHQAVAALKKHNPSEKFRTVGSDVLSSIYANKEHETRTLSGSGLPLKFPTYDAAVARMLTAFSRILACPLPHRGMTATFGHKIVRLDNVLFFFPGWAPSSQRSLDDEPNPFSKIMVMYPQDNFTTATFDCSGSLPPRGLHRYSLNVITARTREEGPQALIFGGSVQEANQTIFSDKLYAFSFHCRKWTCVTPNEDPKGPMGSRVPTARDSHAAAVFPPSSTVDNAVSRSELLCVFGGKSTGLLNDLWMLDLSTVTWNRVHSIDPPHPRAGSSLTWISASELLLYGGETTAPQSSVVAQPILLCATSLPSTSAVSADKQISQSTDFGWKWVQIEGQNDKTSLPRVAYGTPVQIEDMLFIVGGVTPDLPSTDSSLSLISVTVSKNRLRQPQDQSAGETNTSGIVSRNITGVHLFYSYPTDIISDSCRQRLFPAACHFPLPNSSLPCIFVQGGSPFLPASEPNALALSDTWVLSLSGEDPVFNRDSLPVPGHSIVEPRFGTRFDEQQRLAATTATAHQQQTFAAELAQKSMSSPYHTTPSLMWPLGNMTTWSFAAIGQFLHNSAQTRVAAKHFDVSLMPLPKPLNSTTIGSKVLEGLTTIPGFSSNPQLSKTPKSPNYMVVVSDNGEGLGYHALHRFLKRYGSLDSQEFPCIQPNLGKDAYGLGSKLALARLAHSALVFTRTPSMVGVGLYSQRLMASCAAATMIAPVVFWRLPDMSIFDVGLSKLDNRHAQRLIMQYSPFDTPQSLADAMSAFGEENGTRIVLFDLRTDLSNISYCPNTGRLHNTWAPSNVTRQLVANISLKQPKDNVQQEEMTDEVATGGIKTSNDFLSSMIGKKSQPDESFPLWHSEEQSIDFSLDKYLAFFHLHGTQHLSVNRSALAFPKGPNAAPPTEDTYHNSLYRYMQHRLHCKAEFNYLFDVQDSIYRSHAIFGFLNNPQQFPDDPVCETGVLLYHGERLITRLNLPFPSPRSGHSAAKSPYPKNHFTSYEGGSPFPLTALVNVPDWLLPRPSREDFVFERTAIMEEFTNKLEKLIKKYLTLCLDPNSLNAWVATRDQKFDEFAQNTKSKKKPRTGNLDIKENPKAETPDVEGAKPLLEGRTAP